MVTVYVTGKDDAPFIGHNIKSYIADLEREMREAAGNMEFEEAGRLRDEIKRLRETELFVADDPLARQEEVRENLSSAMSGPSTGASLTGASVNAGRRAYRGSRRK